MQYNNGEEVVYAEQYPSDYVFIDEHEAIQKKVFTNWINYYVPNCIENDIINELRDGTKLIQLIEALTNDKLQGERGKKLRRPHFISNVNIVLNYLEKKKIKLVNVNATDIVDGNPCIILGLIWTLILRFHIQKYFKVSKQDHAIPLNENSSFNSSQVPHSFQQNKNKNEISNTRKLLIDNFNRRFNLNITNFRDDWRDGKNMLKIIDQLAPNLNAVNKGNCLNNNLERLKLALNLANDQLSVKKLIDAEDIDLDKSDEKSLITYLSQYLNKYSLNENKNNVFDQKINSTNMFEEQLITHESKLITDFIDKVYKTKILENNWNNYLTELYSLQTNYLKIKSHLSQDYVQKWNIINEEFLLVKQIVDWVDKSEKIIQNYIIPCSFEQCKNQLVIHYNNFSEEFQLKKQPVLMNDFIDKYIKCSDEAKEWKNAMEKAMKMWKIYETAKNKLKSWLQEAESLLLKSHDSNVEKNFRVEYLQNLNNFFDKKQDNEQILKKFIEACEDVLSTLPDKNKNELQTSLNGLVNRFYHIINYRAPQHLNKIQFDFTECEFFDKVQILKNLSKDELIKYEYSILNDLNSLENLGKNYWKNSNNKTLLDKAIYHKNEWEKYKKKLDENYNLIKINAFNLVKEAKNALDLTKKNDLNSEILIHNENVFKKINEKLNNLKNIQKNNNGLEISQDLNEIENQIERILIDLNMVVENKIMNWCKINDKPSISSPFLENESKNQDFLVKKIDFYSKLVHEFEKYDGLILKSKECIDELNSKLDDLNSKKKSIDEVAINYKICSQKIENQISKILKELNDINTKLRNHNYSEEIHANEILKELNSLKKRNEQQFNFLIDNFTKDVLTKIESYRHQCENCEKIPELKQLLLEVHELNSNSIHKIHSLNLNDTLVHKKLIKNLEDLLKLIDEKCNNLIKVLKDDERCVRVITELTQKKIIEEIDVAKNERSNKCCEYSYKSCINTDNNQNYLNNSQIHNYCNFKKKSNSIKEKINLKPEQVNFGQQFNQSQDCLLTEKPDSTINSKQNEEIQNIEFEESLTCLNNIEILPKNNLNLNSDKEINEIEADLKFDLDLIEKLHDLVKKLYDIVFFKDSTNTSNADLENNLSWLKHLCIQSQSIKNKIKNKDNLKNLEQSLIEITEKILILIQQKIVENLAKEKFDIINETIKRDLDFEDNVKKIEYGFILIKNFENCQNDLKKTEKWIDKNNSKLSYLAFKSIENLIDDYKEFEINFKDEKNKLENIKNSLNEKLQCCTIEKLILDENLDKTQKVYYEKCKILFDDYAEEVLNKVSVLDEKVNDCESFECYKNLNQEIENLKENNLGLINKIKIEPNIEVANKLSKINNEFNNLFKKINDALDDRAIELVNYGEFRLEPNILECKFLDLGEKVNLYNKLKNELNVYRDLLTNNELFEEHLSKKLEELDTKPIEEAISKIKDYLNNIENEITSLENGIKILNENLENIGCPQRFTADSSFLNLDKLKLDFEQKHNSLVSSLVEIFKEKLNFINDKIQECKTTDILNNLIYELDDLKGDFNYKVKRLSLGEIDLIKILVHDFNSINEKMQNEYFKLKDEELQKAREEEERLAREEEERRIAKEKEERRIAREEEERLAKEKEERLAKEEKARLAREEEERRIAKEKEKLLAKEEEERLAREEEERRIAKEKEERLAKEEEERRIAKEKEERRIAREEEERLAREEEVKKIVKGNEENKVEKEKFNKPKREFENIKENRIISNEIGSELKLKHQKQPEELKLDEKNKKDFFNRFKPKDEESFLSKDKKENDVTKIKLFSSKEENFSNDEDEFSSAANLFLLKDDGKCTGFDNKKLKKLINKPLVEINDNIVNKTNNQLDENIEEHVAVVHIKKPKKVSQTYLTKNEQTYPLINDECVVFENDNQHEFFNSNLKDNLGLDCKFLREIKAMISDLKNEIDKNYFTYDLSDIINELKKLSKICSTINQFKKSNEYENENNETKEKLSSINNQLVNMFDEIKKLLEEKIFYFNNEICKDSEDLINNINLYTEIVTEFDKFDDLKNDNDKFINELKHQLQSINNKSLNDKLIDYKECINTTNSFMDEVLSKIEKINENLIDLKYNNTLDENLILSELEKLKKVCEDHFENSIEDLYINYIPKISQFENDCNESDDINTLKLILDKVKNLKNKLDIKIDKYKLNQSPLIKNLLDLIEKTKNKIEAKIEDIFYKERFLNEDIKSDLNKDSEKQIKKSEQNTKYLPSETFFDLDEPKNDSFLINNDILLFSKTSINQELTKIKGLDKNEKDLINQKNKLLKELIESLNKFINSFEDKNLDLNQLNEKISALKSLVVQLKYVKDTLITDYENSDIDEAINKLNKSIEKLFNLVQKDINNFYIKENIQPKLNNPLLDNLAKKTLNLASLIDKIDHLYKITAELNKFDKIIQNNHKNINQLLKDLKKLSLLTLDEKNEKLQSFIKSINEWKEEMNKDIFKINHELNIINFNIDLKPNVTLETYTSIKTTCLKDLLQVILEEAKEKISNFDHELNEIKNLNKLESLLVKVNEYKTCFKNKCEIFDYSNDSAINKINDNLNELILKIDNLKEFLIQQEFEKLKQKHNVKIKRKTKSHLIKTNSQAIINSTKVKSINTCGELISFLKECILKLNNLTKESFEKMDLDELKIELNSLKDIADLSKYVREHEPQLINNLDLIDQNLEVLRKNLINIITLITLDKLSDWYFETSDFKPKLEDIDFNKLAKKIEIKTILSDVDNGFNLLNTFYKCKNVLLDCDKWVKDFRFKINYLPLRSLEELLDDYKIAIFNIEIQKAKILDSMENFNLKMEDCGLDVQLIDNLLISELETLKQDYKAKCEELFNNFTEDAINKLKAYSKKCSNCRDNEEFQYMLTEVKDFEVMNTSRVNNIIEQTQISLDRLLGEFNSKLEGQNAKIENNLSDSNNLIFICDICLDVNCKCNTPKLNEINVPIECKIKQTKARKGILCKENQTKNLLDTNNNNQVIINDEDKKNNLQMNQNLEEKYLEDYLKFELWLEAFQASIDKLLDEKKQINQSNICDVAAFLKKILQIKQELKLEFNHKANNNKLIFNQYRMLYLTCEREVCLLKKQLEKLRIGTPINLPINSLTKVIKCQNGIHFKHIYRKFDRQFFCKFFKFTLPIQLLLIVLFGISSLIPSNKNDFSCFLVNNLRKSINPTMNYPNGAPPI